MAGLLNLVPRYLPRYGMAPDWARAVRPLVLVFTAIAFLVTMLFDADVDAQGGAYATGVLVLITSAAVAVTLCQRARHRQRSGPSAFGVIAVVFVYTTVANVIERPDGVKIGGLLHRRHHPRLVPLPALPGLRAARHRRRVRRDGRAVRARHRHRTIRLIANEPDAADAPSTGRSSQQIRRTTTTCPTTHDVIFVEVTVRDPSDFETDLHGARRGRCTAATGCSRWRAPPCRRALAALLLHIRDTHRPAPAHLLRVDRGQPVRRTSCASSLFGQGEVAPVTREVLREAEPDRTTPPARARRLERLLTVVTRASKNLSHASKRHGDGRGAAAQIVTAAIDTIAELGYGNASFARIAKRAGISSTRLISYHFDDKAELVRAVVSAVLAEAADYMGKRLRAGGTRASCWPPTSSRTSSSSPSTRPPSGRSSRSRRTRRTDDGTPLMRADDADDPVARLAALFRERPGRGRVPRLRPGRHGGDAPRGHRRRGRATRPRPPRLRGRTGRPLHPCHPEGPGMTIDRPSPPARPRSRVALLLPMLVDFGIPLVVFYGLRALGVDQWWALLLSGVVPVVAVIVRFVRTRTVDYLAIFVLSVVALSLGVSAMTGDARTMLIRDAWGGLLGGLIALWLLASVWVGRPALLYLFRAFVLAKVGPDGLRAWESKWDTDRRVPARHPGGDVRLGLRRPDQRRGHAGRRVPAAARSRAGRAQRELAGHPGADPVWHLYYTKKRDLRA